MGRRTSRLLLACAVALVFTGCASERHATAYDYEIIRGHIATGRPPLEEQLKEAAADGWQVASSGSDDGIAFIVLKKAK
jgi:hypothetical protein